MKGREIHVAFSCDEGYVMFTGVAIWSLMEHYRGEEPVNVHVVGDGITELSQEKLKQMALPFPLLKLHFHALPEVVFQLPTNAQYRSPSVYGRLFLDEVLPNVQRVLYLDSDILVLGPWEALYDVDLRGFSIAARSEKDFSSLKEHNHRLQRPLDNDYFNTGVLVLDLNLWRKQKLISGLVSLIQARGPFKFPDQDALNIILGAHFCPLEAHWNKCDYRDYHPFLHKEEINILHFIMQKPWRCFSEALEAKLLNSQDFSRLPRSYGCYYFTHLFWKTGKKTPFSEDFEKLRILGKSRELPIKNCSILHKFSVIERFFRKTVRGLYRKVFPSKKVL